MEDSKVNKLLKKIENDAKILALSYTGYAIGAYLMADDHRDIPKIVCPGCRVLKTPHLHHWFIGALLMVASFAGMAYSLANIAMKLSESEEE